MTTSSQDTRPRSTEDICPPWCNGHDELYNPWEQRLIGDGLLREHSGVTISVAGVGVYVTQTENQDQAMTPAVLNVHVDGPGDLTPGEARAFAAALVMLAAQMETQQ